ncbi:hypothetical protein Syun_030109 [Stephania yunnanensis]|uniref:Uncharacterized protein n=1 Tax=Stephania yunnanensis TaxID=152371 RepID=A0AAP0E6Q7_9MAGN
MGEKDYTLKFSGMEEYLNETKTRDYDPNLETVFLNEGTHFIQGQFPDQVQPMIVLCEVRHDTELKTPSKVLNIHSTTALLELNIVLTPSITKARRHVSIAT